MSTNEAEIIGQRLKAEVDRLGGPTAVASKLGVNRNTVTNWYSSGAIDLLQLSALTELGADYGFLMTGLRTGSSREELSSEDVAYSLPPTMSMEMRERERIYHASLSVEDMVGLIQAGTYVWIPYYDVPLSGGGGAEVLDQPPKQWNIYNRRYLVEERGLNPVHIMECPVRGVSMFPLLRDRQTAMIDRSKVSVDVPDVYAVRKGNELFIKTVERVDGGVRCTSKNPDAPGGLPFLIPGSDFDQNHAAIIGKWVPP